MLISVWRLADISSDCNPIWWYLQRQNLESWNVKQTVNDDQTF